MKNIFKAFIIVIFSFALCLPMQILVKASTFTDMGPKNDVSVSKTWTVSFNKALDSTTVNTTNIKVVGENNVSKEIKVSLANSNKNIIVEPITNYEPNKSYTLIVTQMVKSFDGKPLTEEVRMGFTTISTPIVTVSSVNDLNVTINQGETYTFPTTVQATMSNGLKNDVGVVWDSSTIDTSKVSVNTYKGTITGSAINVNLVVSVIATTPKKYKIVLDAGHGGYDTGAIGPTGVLEKNVTLAITLKIGAILTKNGVDTIYTRTSDTVSWSNDVTQNLQAICDISNNAKPDYFVSIHANSFSGPSASGIETYYFTGSAAGQKLAQAVQTELIKGTGRVDRGLKTTSGLYVIKNTVATAILVETSFISNPTEESLLASSDYQNKLAKAISTGILKTLGITNIVY
jgi:N-acetylmuramoyl-L-alanine amidase CwlD